MFTGIVQACLPVAEVQKGPGLLSFTLALPPPLNEGLSLGASIAIDGVCLTVAGLEEDGDRSRVRFDAMAETLNKTTLGSLEEGRRVNVERSARIGDEIGGHLVSGHVAARAKIVAVSEPENNRVVSFEAPVELMDYIFEKGFIALDGCSLTLVDVRRGEARFDIWFIPETLRVTTFGFKGVGDEVNLEIDSQTRTIVETVRAVLERERS